MSNNTNNTKVYSFTDKANPSYCISIMMVGSEIISYSRSIDQKEIHNATPTNHQIIAFLDNNLRIALSFCKSIIQEASLKNEFFNTKGETLRKLIERAPFIFRLKDEPEAELKVGIMSEFEVKGNHIPAVDGFLLSLGSKEYEFDKAYTIIDDEEDYVVCKLGMEGYNKLKKALQTAEKMATDTICTQLSNKRVNRDFKK